MEKGSNYVTEQKNLKSHQRYLSGQVAGSLEAVGQTLKLILDHLGSEDYNPSAVSLDLRKFKDSLLTTDPFALGDELLFLKDFGESPALVPLPKDGTFREGFRYSVRRLTYLLFGEENSGN